MENIKIFMKEKVWPVLKLVLRFIFLGIRWADKQLRYCSTFYEQFKFVRVTFWLVALLNLLIAPDLFFGYALLTVVFCCVVKFHDKATEKKK